MSYSSGCRRITGHIRFGQDLKLLMSFPPYPGQWCQAPPGATYLAPYSGLFRLWAWDGAGSPVGCVVVANCPRTLALCLEFPGWHHLCPHPCQFTFLASVERTAELPEAAIFWSSDSSSNQSHPLIMSMWMGGVLGFRLEGHLSV